MAERKIISWREPLGNPECPYAKRWVLNLGLFAIRLHHWIRSDEAKDLHDHPYWFITWVIGGPGYLDIQQYKTIDDNELPFRIDVLKRWSLRFRKATHVHTVMLKFDKETRKPIPCWTLLLTGPPLRKWGFWVGNRWQKASNYFKKHGYHQCD